MKNWDSLQAGSSAHYTPRISAAKAQTGYWTGSLGLDGFSIRPIYRVYAKASILP
jgi:hypothetical protein